MPNGEPENPTPKESDESQMDFGRRGRYDLRYIYGEGNLGRVWLAEDPYLGRTIAVKEIQPDLACDADCRQRFLEESAITGQLEHPNIIPVYDFGFGENAYLAMRLIHGMTLSEALYQFDMWTRTSPSYSDLRVRRAELLQSFIHVCKAIGYAHSRGIVHRDLKPDNIILGKHGEVYVVDWGLAKILRQESADNVDLGLSSVVAKVHQTQTGDVIGTPLYMSPEQAMGRKSIIDARADIYGLGGILYEMITNKAPHQTFPFDEPQIFLDHVIDGRIPRPQSIRPSCPHSIAAVCMKALARDPDDRYQTAEDLAKDVERFLVGAPVTCHREPVSQRFARWMMRHRALTQSVTLALVLFTLLITVLATQTWRDMELNERLEMQQVRNNASDLSRLIQTALEHLVAVVMIASSSDVIHQETLALQSMDDARLDAMRPAFRRHVTQILSNFAAIRELGIITYHEGKPVVMIGETPAPFPGPARIWLAEDGKVPFPLETLDAAEQLLQSGQIDPRFLLIDDKDPHAERLVCLVPIVVEGPQGRIGVIVATIHVHQFLSMIGDDPFSEVFLVDEDGHLLLTPPGQDLPKDWYDHRVWDYFPDIKSYFTTAGIHKPYDIEETSDGQWMLVIRQISVPYTHPPRYISIILAASRSALFNESIRRASIVILMAAMLVILAIIALLYGSRVLVRTAFGQN